MTDSHSPPDGLGAPGRALWSAVWDTYELDHPSERELLLEAARCTDELGRLADALRDAPLVVAGSTGQDRPHPLLDEVRKHRATLVAVVGALRQLNMLTLSALYGVAAVSAHQENQVR